MTPGFNVVGEAASGEEAVEVADALRPAVVLMDINLPGMNGMEATRQITDARPETVVLLLSTYGTEDLPVDAGSSGFTAYVNKDEFSPDVLQHIWETHVSTGPGGSAPEER
jgi:DNA-binding NarL/FixJ family response regulator